MKKLFILIFSVAIVCVMSNDAIAQKSAKKAESPLANKYVQPNGTSIVNGPVKVHAFKKQDLINSLQQRINAVNTSTTLTAAEKQELIILLEAKLAELQ